MKKRNNSKPKHNAVTTLKLRVTGCKIKDVGKKKALLDNAIMKKLGVSNGDVVEIVGNKVTAVIVSPLEDKIQKNNYIHIDGQTRKNAGVSLNDYVLIKKTNPKFAEKVILLCNPPKVCLMTLFHSLIHVLRVIQLQKVINLY